MLKKTKETTKMKTPVFTVVEKEFDNVPNFKPVGLNCNDWCMLIAADASSRENPVCVFVEQTRWGAEAKTIEFPCGTVEDSEMEDLPFEGYDDALKEVRKNAAIREFEEETGIDLGPYKERVGLLGTFNPNPAYFNNHMSIFCVKVPDLLERFQNRNKQNLDENEDCRVFVDRVLNRYWDLSSHAMGIAALQKMAITPVDALEYCEAIPKQPK
jgi:8-oxo-dGTP pyrophosphatase MutT (NUDIX family)